MLYGLLLNGLVSKYFLYLTGMEDCPQASVGYAPESGIFPCPASSSKGTMPYGGTILYCFGVKIISGQKVRIVLMVLVLAYVLCCQAK